MDISICGQPNLRQCAIIDHAVVPIVRRMMHNGVSINREHCYDLSTYLSKEMEDVAEKISEYVPRAQLDAFTEESISESDFNVDSPDQIAQLLFKHLKVGAGMELSTTKSGTRLSTGKKQLERLKTQHDVIPLILQRREYAKLKNTYSDKLPKIAQFDKKSGQWRIYTKFGLTFTTTGRMNSSKPNLQNIPMKTELGRRIKQAFIPSPGKVFVSADYAAIELRLLAHCANERKMTEIFCTPGGDVHAVTQAGLPIPDTLDDIQKRLIAKRTGFGIVYGQTDLGLWLTLQSEGVPCTQELAARFINGFYATYPDISPYVSKQHYRARRYGMTWSIFGRPRLVPETRSVHRRIVSAGLRQAQNQPIQTGAADIFKIGAADVHDLGEEIRAGLLNSKYTYWEPLLAVHDQLLHESDPEISEEAAGATEYVMSNCVSLNVPLRVDWSIQPDCWKK